MLQFQMFGDWQSDRVSLREITFYDISIKIFSLICGQQVGAGAEIECLSSYDLLETEGSLWQQLQWKLMNLFSCTSRIPGLAGGYWEVFSGTGHLNTKVQLEGRLSTRLLLLVIMRVLIFHHFPSFQQFFFLASKWPNSSRNAKKKFSIFGDPPS